MPAKRSAEYINHEHFTKSSTALESFVYGFYDRLLASNKVSKTQAMLLTLLSTGQNCLVVYMLVYPIIKDHIQENPSQAAFWMIGLRRFASILSPVLDCSFSWTCSCSLTSLHTRISSRECQSSAWLRTA